MTLLFHVIDLQKSSEGAKKAWETRRHGGSHQKIKLTKQQAWDLREQERKAQMNLPLKERAKLKQRYDELKQDAELSSEEYAKKYSKEYGEKYLKEYPYALEYRQKMAKEIVSKPFEEQLKLFSEKKKPEDMTWTEYFEHRKATPKGQMPGQFYAGDVNRIRKDYKKLQEKKQLKLFPEKKPEKSLKQKQIDAMTKEERKKYMAPWGGRIGKPKIESSKAHFTPKEVSSAIDKLKTATIEDVQGGKIPLAFYGGNELGPEIVAQFSNGKIRLFDGFFKMPAEDRPSLLYHEFGHEVTRIAFGYHSDETNSMLKPFQLGTMRYDNFAGASYRPDEMIADIYSEAMTVKEPIWESGGKYERMTDYILNIAHSAGLPTPKWFTSKSVPEKVYPAGYKPESIDEWMDWHEKHKDELERKQEKRDVLFKKSFYPGTLAMTAGKDLPRPRKIKDVERLIRKVEKNEKDRKKMLTADILPENPLKQTTGSGSQAVLG